MGSQRLLPRSARRRALSCSLVTVRDLRDTDASLIERLVAGYPYKPYRHYRVWPRARQDAIMRADVQRTLGTTGVEAVVAGGGDEAVIALARPLEWDSRFFAVPMARLDWQIGRAHV